MPENSKAASIQIEAEGLSQAGRQSRFRQEIAELKSQRQPSPDMLQNFDSLEENLRSTTKELKVVREEVAGLKRERTVLKSTTDRLQNDVTSSRDEVAGLRSELAE